MNKKVILLTLIGLILMSVLSPIHVVGQENYQSNEQDTSLNVEIESNGNVEFDYLISFSTDNESDEEVFNEIKNDGDLLEEYRKQHEQGLQVTAENINNQVERNVSVSNVEIDTVEDGNGDKNYIVLRSEWENLAYTENQNIVLEEPFNSNFEFNGKVSVTGPDGMEVKSEGIEPDRNNENYLMWNDFDSGNEFKVTFYGNESNGYANKSLAIGIVGFFFVVVGGVFYHRHQKIK